MAARGHVQDPNDRRLRPIYDYLDNGNNKMAIQQADKLLKKHKDLHCAKVLKAIGLQRTGKQDEAFTLAQEVAVLEPTDDNSLQALTILYREMHRPELVTKLYEAAVRKVPTSEEYHSHLFMAYARVGEYKKMQQAGMALYKIVPKNPYYFWSVMSLVMQSISAQDEKLSQTMFLPLAERMVEKMVKEEKIEAEAEVQLYFMILERLGKYVEALEVVQGPLGGEEKTLCSSKENSGLFPVECMCVDEKSLKSTFTLCCQTFKMTNKCILRKCSTRLVTLYHQDARNFNKYRSKRMLLDLFLEADISSPLEESVKSMSLCPEEDDIPWDSLRDNRDLTVLVSWDPKDRQLNEEHRQRSLEEDTLWLRLRSLTLRLIGCVSALTHPPASRNSEKTTENGVAAKPSSLQSLLSQLENTLNQATQFSEKQLQVRTVTDRLANAGFFCFFCQDNIFNFHFVRFYFISVNQNMLEKCKGDLLEVKDSHSMTQHFLLENLVYFVESVCIVLWVSNYCGSVLRPLKSSLQKKKKKKKEASTVTPPVLSAYQEFSSSLQSLLNQALEHIKSQEISLTALKLEALSLEGQTQSEAEATFTKTAMDKVQSSYLRSLQEIGELLKKRADTLKSLKI
uniref:N(alpha)-acetyltransferase 25, NatB auxiliary subunit n=1 Tax=Cyprinus carpio TaxID=7962 RepID=A0A8C1Q219_CYPCA